MTIETDERRRNCRLTTVGAAMRDAGPEMHSLLANGRVLWRRSPTARTARRNCWTLRVPGRRPHGVGDVADVAML